MEDDSIVPGLALQKPEKAFLRNVPQTGTLPLITFSGAGQ